MRRERKNGRLAGVLLAVGAVVSGCGGSLTARPDVASLRVPVERRAWRFGDIAGQELRTEHYRIYTTTANRTLLQHLPGFLERARRQYLELTGLGADGPTARAMAVYMFADRQQWAVLTREVTAPRQELFLGIENGGYCFRGVCVFWDLRDAATFAVAAHEGLHQFFHHHLRQQLPAWVEEGLCVLAEGMSLDQAGVRFLPERNPARLLDLRGALVAGRWIPLKRLLPSDAGDHITQVPGQGPEYYGHLWALMLFLRSRPETNAALQRIVQDAAAGRLRQAVGAPAGMAPGREYNRAVAVPVFRRYVDSDLEGFERRFKAYALKLARLDG